MGGSESFFAAACSKLPSFKGRFMSSCCKDCCSTNSSEAFPVFVIVDDEKIYVRDQETLRDLKKMSFWDLKKELRHAKSLDNLN